MLIGGCYCGAIRYVADEPAVNQAICHCVMCRGTTGAPCVAWFTVSRHSYRLLSGTPTTFRSSNYATRSFCPTCGTQLSFADDALPAEIDITTASLDDPAQAPPQSHIFTRSAIPWLVPGDTLPRYPGSRNES